MKLKLQREGTVESWTLKPTRSYTIGKGADCDIVLEGAMGIAERHLQLSYNSAANGWVARDLNSGYSTTFNNQVMAHCSIVAPTRISLAGNLLLVATPETLAVTSPPPSLSPTPPYQASSSPSPQQFPTTTLGWDRGTVQKKHSFSSSVLSWSQYVEAQLDSQGLADFSRFAARFHIITGFRNTPWLRAYGEQANNFNAFDGYIIPNFKGSAREVASKIEQNLGQLEKYKDTNCFVVKLTDAHIADSATQSFLGVEFFPIIRSHTHNRADYRQFCVVSYHHVKTYLLVENYGEDLFVGWISRYEPYPTSGRIVFTLLLALILILPLLATGNLFIIITPILIWSEIYLMTPAIMNNLGIVPKKANARFIIIASLLITAFLWIPIIGASVISQINPFHY